MMWYGMILYMILYIMWYHTWCDYIYDMIWLYLYIWKHFFVYSIWKTQDLSSRFSYYTIFTYYNRFEPVPCFKLVCLHFTTVYISHISLTLHFPHVISVFKMKTLLSCYLSRSYFWRKKLASGDQISINPKSIGDFFVSSGVLVKSQMFPAISFHFGRVGNSLEMRYDPFL